MLTIITGKSGSGKSTIVKELKKYGFHPILTTTSRPIRDGETQDIDYHFTSEQDFWEKVEHDFFVEYKIYKTKLGTWCYGTAREDIVNAGDKDIIILTPDGYRDIVRKYPNFKHRLIYIYANNLTIKNRLTRRGDKKEEVERRFNQDHEDFKGIESLAHKIFYNNDSDKLYNVVQNIRKYLEVND